MILLLVIGILSTLIIQSIPSLKQFGLIGFYFSSVWDSREGMENYGALTFIAGSVLTAFLALLIALPFSMSLVIFNEAYVQGKGFEKPMNIIIDIATTIPSIIWGVWGFHVVRPLLSALNIGNQGYGILCTSIVLALMIIPYAASYATIFIRNIPIQLKENAYSLGATGMEVIWKVNLPYAGKGIISSHLLALGRAFGEAIVVVILIGNSYIFPSGLFDTGNTMSSILINQGGSASDLQLSAIFAIALFLFLLTAGINILAKYLISKTS